MKFTAVGDILPQRRVLSGYDGFDDVKNFIYRGDARFFNLETTLNNPGECFASQFSGGTYVRNDPEVLSDILKFGFNMTSANNNHALDFSYRGLEATMQSLRATGIVNSGLGNNLHEASAPAYLETPSGRIALISVCTSFNPSMMAGTQSRRTPGRPGINGIRVSCDIVLPEDAFLYAEKIGKLSGINLGAETDRKDGYILPLPDSVCEIGAQHFVRGDAYGLKWKINESDCERLISSVEEANARADYIILSVHTHQHAVGEKYENPAFVEELAHLAIDAGVDAIIGHGPHLLRPIEVYKERPIFYSLGDFILQLYDVPYAPEEFYSKYGMNSDSTVVELLEKRSAGYTRGLMESEPMLQTVIPYWETDGKKLKSLKLMPIQLSRHQGKYLEGLPRQAKDYTFMKHLAEISAPYGVKIQIGSDGIADCLW